jgi:uncharacterized protein YndB with AHSA1/START domain
MTVLANAHISADPEVPVIHITRDFDATPEQLFRAHTDPTLFVQWIGPDSLTSTVEYWDARSGGNWKYVMTRDGDEFVFHGCADLHLRRVPGPGRTRDDDDRGPR